MHKPWHVASYKVCTTNMQLKSEVRGNFSLIIREPKDKDLPMANFHQPRTRAVYLLYTL